MKILLRELVNWMECCDLRRSPCGSPFEEPVDPVQVMRAEVALDWSRGGQRVDLFTTTINPKSLIAALVFRRANVNVESVFRSGLDDSEVDQLAACLSEIRTLD
jgi:hypothetical protein